jgi:hypothetical protein
MKTMPAFTEVSAPSRDVLFLQADAWHSNTPAGIWFVPKSLAWDGNVSGSEVADELLVNAFRGGIELFEHDVPLGRRWNATSWRSSVMVRLRRRLTCTK